MLLAVVFVASLTVEVVFYVEAFSWVVSLVGKKEIGPGNNTLQITAYVSKLFRCSVLINRALICYTVRYFQQRHCGGRAYNFRMHPTITP